MTKHAKLLYLCRRTQQDIQTAVAFLCIRFKSPDEDDYKKLMRAIQYLKGRKEITPTIKRDNNGHKIHMGMYMTM